MSIKTRLNAIERAADALPLEFIPTEANLAQLNAVLADEGLTGDRATMAAELRQLLAEAEANMQAEVGAHG